MKCQKISELKYSDSKHYTLDGNIVINNKTQKLFVHWRVDGDHFHKPIDKLELTFHEKELKDYLDFLTDKYVNTSKLFYWIEYAEVYNLDDINNPLFPHLKFLKEYFQSKNLFDRFYILTENLYNNYTEFKTIRTTQWLGFHNSDMVYLPSNLRRYSKTFLYLNRKHRIHREKLFYSLKDKGLLEDCLYSYRSFDNENISDRKKVNIKNDKEVVSITGHHMNFSDVNVLARTAFCHLVTETVFYNEKYYGDVCFITEKVDKPINYGSPFIIVSTSGYLKELRKFGFKTFSQWWDESYDEETDSERRLQKIIQLVEEISNWSWDKKYKIYDEMIPTLIHNQRVRTAIVDYKIYNPAVSDEVLLMDRWTYYDDLIYFLNKVFLPSLG